MTKSKLVAQRVTEVPEEILRHLSAYARTHSTGHVRSCIALSFDNRYVTDDSGKPIMLIWAYRMTFLSPHLEINMIASEFLAPQHVRECKALIWEWIEKQTLSVYAVCDSPMTERFLRFMGFEKTEEMDGKFKYEARH